MDLALKASGWSRGSKGIGKAVRARSRRGRVGCGLRGSKASLEEAARELAGATEGGRLPSRAI